MSHRMLIDKWKNYFSNYKRYKGYAAEPRDELIVDFLCDYGLPDSISVPLREWLKADTKTGEDLRKWRQNVKPD